MSLFYQGWLARIIEVKIDKINDQEVVLGEGGYGIVYRGKMKIENLNDRRETKVVPIAIKRIKIKTSQWNGKDPLEYIKRELAVYEQIKSKNIVQLYGSEKQNNYYDLYLELCDGSLLDCILNKEKETPLQENEALRYFKEIIDVLELLKRSTYERTNDEFQELYHRDINVKNILYKKCKIRNRIKVCDFGVSQYGLDNSKSNLKLSKQAGTKIFMSPENLQMEDYQLEQNDSWSLGILLFCLLFGYEFYKRNLPKFLSNNNEDHYSLINKNTLISNEVKILLFGLLQKDPQKRYTFQKIQESLCYKLYKKGTFKQGKKIQEFIQYRFQSFSTLTTLFIKLNENLFQLISKDLLLIIFYQFKIWIYKQCENYSGYYFRDSKEKDQKTSINNYSEIPNLLINQFQIIEKIYLDTETNDQDILFWRKVLQSRKNKICFDDEKFYHLNLLQEIFEKLDVDVSIVQQKIENVNKQKEEKDVQNKEKLNLKLQKLEQQRQEKKIHYDNFRDLINEISNHLWWKVHKNYDKQLYCPQQY